MVREAAQQIFRSFSAGLSLFGFTQPPQSFIKELETVIYDFTWNGNLMIKRSVLINNICKGGLKAIHIESFINSLKCTWIRRYCDSVKGLWKIFFDIELSKYAW